MRTHNKDIADGLRKVLADTFVLYFKTHSFHWNVEGLQFKSLHELFMTQYTELWTATDELAERLRAMDYYAPNNWKEIYDNASLQEVGQTPDAGAMVKMLANDNSAIAESIKPVLDAAQAQGDEVTTDLLIGRMAVHEKAAWMLRSLGK